MDEELNAIKLEKRDAARQKIENDIDFFGVAIMVSLFVMVALLAHIGKTIYGASIKMFNPLMICILIVLIHIWSEEMNELDKRKAKL